MLFDLRSRGRRRTVRVIYVGLALLMLGGLVLFGVGTGTNQGGLLNAFTNTGSGGSGGSSGLNAQVRSALKATDRNPTSASAWATLINARWSDAGSGSNYDTATDTYTASGKKQLNLLGQDFQKYGSLTKTPSLEVSQLAAESYGYLAQFVNEGNAWEDVIGAEPRSDQAKGYECLAASAYAAKQTDKAKLAQAAALSRVPKIQQAQIKSLLSEAKTNPEIAEDEC